MNAPNFNPFERSKLTFVEPLVLVSHEYFPVSLSYRLEYRASRGAANLGLLEQQFKVGALLVVENEHVVIREVGFSVTNGAIDEVTIRVVAVSLALFLQNLNPDIPIVTTSRPAAIPTGFGPVKRKILK